jgi:protein-tyrosine phosphatase
VAFVCTGNFYRSRLAEEIFRFYAENSGRDVFVISRGLAVQDDLKGMHPEAITYLETLGVRPPSIRNPLPLLVDELIATDHLVLLNRSEHEPLMERGYKAVYRKLLNQQAVSHWNVFDFYPPSAGWKKESRPSQPLESAMEHIHFAAKDLVRSL